MKKILLIGAGRSTPSLLRYLSRVAGLYDWKVVVGDLSKEHAEQMIQGLPNVEAIIFDIHNPSQREVEIAHADLVISMVPARFHAIVAKACVAHGTDMLTASYVSPDIAEMDVDARAKGMLILMECGLDPGIDHMSAMRVMNQISSRSGKLISFETFTGGLLAPNPEKDNPWEYKFTWNPRNVVLAGQGIIKFIHENRYKYIPYHRLFRRTEIIHIPGYGYFEGYANRDSLKYVDVYGLRGLHTLFRGTLRRVGFCKAWDIFVQLGATDDSYEMEHVAQMTHRDFLNSFLSFNPHDSVELRLAHYLQLDLDSDEMYKLRWLGMFSEEVIGLDQGTPAQLLEHILKKRWTMTEDDKDMIVMWHKFDFEEAGTQRQIQSYMVSIGEDAKHTAMAQTVGLPLGIAAKLILNKQISLSGVHVPILPEVYNPILNELTEAGIRFSEIETSPAHK